MDTLGERVNHPFVVLLNVLPQMIHRGDTGNRRIIDPHCRETVEFVRNL